MGSNQLSCRLYRTWSPLENAGLKPFPFSKYCSQQRTPVSVSSEATGMQYWDSQYCIPVASLPGRSHLRSAASGDLFVPATSTKTIDPRGFFHAGLTAWNYLPPSMKDPNITFLVFKNCLKLNFSNTDHSRMHLCGSSLERHRCNTSIIITAGGPTLDLNQTF